MQLKSQREEPVVSVAGLVAEILAEPNQERGDLVTTLLEVIGS